MTTDLLGSSETNATITVEGGEVSLAGRSSVSLDSNVTIFTISGTPRVSDQPIVTFLRISTVTDQSDGVVNVDVIRTVATVENTRFVIVEVGSINGDDDGTLSGNSVQESFVVVFGELNVTINSNFNGLSLGVEGTVTGGTLVRRVRVLVFRGQTEKLDVVVGQFRDSTVATTLTTTLVSVLDARNHLLGGEGLEVTRVDGSERFNDGSGSESPARTAVTLILNGGNNTSFSPIDVSGEISNVDLFSSLQVSEHIVLVSSILSTLGETHGGFLEFFSSSIGERVNTLLVTIVGVRIVGLDLSNLLFEDSLSGVVFSRELSITLVEVLNVFVKGVVGQLVPLGTSSD